MDLMSDSDDHAGEHADSVLDREARA